MPKYSICVCNYNMGRTLETALRSILSQIDERFEVVLVDDGSSDNSLEIAQALQKTYTALKIHPLARDRGRQLGFTRNASVQNAAGEYVLLHLDCDDVTAPHIKDFIEVFHQIETARGKDILLSGVPIQMGRRDFLLRHGPYRNIHRGEDRDMWGRFSKLDACVYLRNRSLKTVLPKTAMDKVYRSIYYTFDHLRNDFRSGAALRQFLYYEFFKQKNFHWKTRLIRFACTMPAFVKAKLQGPLPYADTIKNYQEFADYRNRNSGSFAEILRQAGKEPDWSRLSPASRVYFDQAADA